MEQFEIGDLLPLTDDDGKEENFEVIGVEEMNGETYLALVNAEVEEPEEYAILKVADDNGETVLVTVDDDDEFDAVSDVFDDKFFNEIDYDEGEKSDN